LTPQKKQDSELQKLMEKADDQAVSDQERAKAKKRRLRN